MEAEEEKVTDSCCDVCKPTSESIKFIVVQRYSGRDKDDAAL